MDKITRMGPPEAVSVTDGLYSFVVRLNEPPAGHWIYAFRLTKASGDFDPERVVFDPERGLLFASEEPLVPDWIQHIDFWILAANAQVAADEAAEGPGVLWDTMTLTLSRTSSAASAGSRSYIPSA